MNLGIEGRRALVCAASRGLGRACAHALAQEGVKVTITGRHQETLALAAEEIEVSTGMRVTFALGDIGTEEGRRAALAACPEPDILVTNAGGPPLGRFETLSDDQWLSAISLNMLAQLSLIRSVHGGMRLRHFGRIVNITSAYVKAPVELLALSVGPRAGLTAAIAWLAREGSADNVTINNLLPEMIDTDRSRAGLAEMAHNVRRDSKEFLAALVASLPARRLGQPDELGSMCAFLCSDLAGCITNQNIVIDGGHYPGLF